MEHSSTIHFLECQQDYISPGRELWAIGRLAYSPPFTYGSNLSQFSLVICGLRDFHIFGALKKESGWQAIGDRHRRETSCHLTTEACCRFLKRGYTNFSPMPGQMLQYERSSVEVLCVQCATHVTCALRSRINIFGVRGYVAVFYKLFYISDFENF